MKAFIRARPGAPTSLYAATLSAAFLLAADSVAAQSPAQTPTDAGSITAQEIDRHIRVVAADSMMGRNTPSLGLEKTAQYVADQFKKFGLKPGGDKGTWFQRYAIEGDTATAPNTVGILEGTDPKLKNEYIVFSAHMDHEGARSDGKSADSIYNGADDNGSGTVGVIELAKAFSQPGARPKRSIIFLTVSGEEKGLWGSEHFVEHSPVPLTQIVANINVDMIGRGTQGTPVMAVGRKHSDLGATLDSVNARHPELRMAFNDPPPLFDLLPTADGISASSDHIPFAHKGVPVLCFSTGLHEDYHQVTDSPEKIHTEDEARLLRLVYYVGQQVAGAPERPQWNPDSYEKIVRP